MLAVLRELRRWLIHSIHPRLERHWGEPFHSKRELHRRERNQMRAPDLDREPPLRPAVGNLLQFVPAFHQLDRVLRAALAFEKVESALIAIQARRLGIRGSADNREVA